MHRAISLLKAQGFVKAVVEFSGGHDEGGIDSINVFREDGIAQGLDQWYGSSRYDRATGQFIKETPPTSDAELADALGEPVYEKYGGFGGEFYTSGTVTFDVAAGTTKIQGTESIPTDFGFEEDY